MFLEAEEGGAKYNVILPGETAVPVDTIEGLTSAVFGGIKSYATDIEDDESLRARVINKISGVGESGNKQHYKIWCESVDGVSKARIFPLWNGGNTVKAVLINADGLPCSDAVTEAVQQFIDPDSFGKTVTVGTVTYKVGDGLGEGTAPIGAHFTAIPAFKYEIEI
ncbi:MAG: baseplate J/gp47 family protein, partial [Oscillospiraceae bacterium]|nr:baseplate J/gp47 family protein [Oscillospiraceae bacterium]